MGLCTENINSLSDCLIASKKYSDSKSTEVTLCIVIFREGFDWYKAGEENEVVRISESRTENHGLRGPL